MMQTTEWFKKWIKEGITLVDFYADWCGPCKMLTPIIDELVHEYLDKVFVLKVDIEALPELATEYGVMSIPSVILIKDWEKIWETIIWVHPKDTYVEAIEEIL